MRVIRKEWDVWIGMDLVLQVDQEIKAFFCMIFEEKYRKFSLMDINKKCVVYNGHQVSQCWLLEGMTIM